MITDEQVDAALEAARDEFVCWRLMSMGEAGSRIIREPRTELSLDPTSHTATFTMIPLAPGEDAKEIFRFHQSRAGMRAALESLNVASQKKP